MRFGERIAGSTIIKRFFIMSHVQTSAVSSTEQLAETEASSNLNSLAKPAIVNSGQEQLARNGDILKPAFNDPALSEQFLREQEVWDQMRLVAQAGRAEWERQYPAYEYRGYISEPWINDPVLLERYTREQEVYERQFRKEQDEQWGLGREIKLAPREPGDPRDPQRSEKNKSALYLDINYIRVPVGLHDTVEFEFDLASPGLTSLSMTNNNDTNIGMPKTQFISPSGKVYDGTILNADEVGRWKVKMNFDGNVYMGDRWDFYLTIPGPGLSKNIFSTQGAYSTNPGTTADVSTTTPRQTLSQIANLLSELLMTMNEQNGSNVNGSLAQDAQAEEALTLALENLLNVLRKRRTGERS